MRLLNLRSSGPCRRDIQLAQVQAGGCFWFQFGRMFRDGRGKSNIVENEENGTPARTRTGAPTLGIVHYQFWPVPEAP